jgi:hypothetical protein
MRDSSSRNRHELSVLTKCKAPVAIPSGPCHVHGSDMHGYREHESVNPSPVSILRSFAIRVAFHPRTRTAGLHVGVIPPVRVLTVTTRKSAPDGTGTVAAATRSTFIASPSPRAPTAGHLWVHGGLGDSACQQSPNGINVSYYARGQADWGIKKQANRAAYSNATYGCSDHVASFCFWVSSSCRRGSALMILPNGMRVVTS